MTVFRWNIKPMGDMMKGDIPYDGAAFARHAKDLAAAASVDLLSGFPEESEEGDTDAKPEVWMDWEDFQKKFKDLQEQSAKLAEVAAGGGRGVIAEQFNATAETCKACHKKFKE
jgi:cytochrome c556